MSDRDVREHYEDVIERLDRGRDTLRWHLLHAEAELENAHWALKRINGRTQYAEHGEDTEDQQALREIGEWCRKELER